MLTNSAIEYEYLIQRGTVEYWLPMIKAQLSAFCLLDQTKPSMLDNEIAKNLGKLTCVVLTVISIALTIACKLSNKQNGGVENNEKN